MALIKCLEWRLTQTRLRPIHIGLLVFLISAKSVFAVTDSDIKQLQKGVTTYDQVIAKFGEPSTTQTNDEGLKAIAYIDNNVHLNSASTASLIGSVASIFIPGGGGLALSTASLAGGTLAGGAEGNSSMSAFAFDRSGVLIYYRASVATSTSGTFNSKTTAHVITSDDGAAPMPSVTVALSDDQKKSIREPELKDGKPRLGVHFIQIRSLDAKVREQFMSAKFDGLIVVNVAEDSTAQKAGILAGDYIYMANGTLVPTTEDMRKIMSGVKKGDTIKIRAKRIDEAAHLSREIIFTASF